MDPDHHHHSDDDAPSGLSPGFTTTCHPQDECAICNIYADHFDISSLLSRLSSTDAYTQGLHQGLALQTQETDTQISRYRSRLASSHLKVQQVQAESMARQHAIQELQMQMMKDRMELEILKREIALERDRSMALETACDELQMEVADERRKNRGGGGGSVPAPAPAPANANPNSNAYYEGDGDWIWSWDDDWEKDDELSDDSADDTDHHGNRPSTSSGSAAIRNATKVSSASHPRSAPGPGPPISPVSPDEDWGWVYDISSSIESGPATVDHLYSAGVYWEDYQESDKAFFDGTKQKDSDKDKGKDVSHPDPVLPSASTSTSTSSARDRALARARARLHEHTSSATTSTSADAYTDSENGTATATGYQPEWNWSQSIRNASVQLPLDLDLRGTTTRTYDYDDDEEDDLKAGKGKGKGMRKSRETSMPPGYSPYANRISSGSESSTSPSPSTSRKSSSASSISTSGYDLNLTIAQIAALITIASSPTSTESASSLAHIRTLIQHAERTPKKDRSDAQVWLLINWRRPSPGSSSQPSNAQQVQRTPSVKAPYHPTLTLPSIPEIYVDASSTGVGFYFPLQPSTTTSASTAGSNPAQWLAYRWAPAGHPSIPLGSSGKIVISWAELVAVEMGVYILRALGYGCGGGGGPGGGTPKTRIIVRSDNLGVVKALLSLSKFISLSSSRDQSLHGHSPKVGTDTDIDNQNHNAWTRTHGLNAIVHRILRACALYNLDLDVRWVKSKENLADGPSRATWSGVWSTRLFGMDGRKMEMLDWDLLQTGSNSSTAGLDSQAEAVIERVPPHLRGVLVPVGVGVKVN